MPDSPSDPEPDYQVEIRRDTYGVPHIKADDLPSAIFGAGYATAEDHGCTIAEQILKVRSERAMYWGAGEDDTNLNSDLAYKHIGVYQLAEDHFSELPQEVRDVITAWSAGFNTYYDEVGAEGFKGSCAGEPWVRHISPIDYYAYFRELALLGSGRQLLDYIATATPPGSAQFPAPGLERLRVFKDEPFGSNGWGIGSDLSATGGGMLLANPHFPWQGELRLWESHITVPGELNVYGASLIGVPAILIGFNEAVAWTHTVSAGQRFTFYRLDLVPDNPTAYFKEGEEVQMSSSEYTVMVLGDDGELTQVNRTLYRTEYGPTLNVSPFNWTAEYGVTYRDTNINNTSLIAQFLAMNKADSMDAFQAAHEDNLGIPWVNTISTSAEGRAWYMDSTPTPHLSDEALTAWQERLEDGDFFTVAFDSLSTIILEGNKDRDGWLDEAGARDPGLVPWDKMPQLERSDFVFNANDSHWMSNPAELLEGYSFLHGWERTARTPRTRMNATLLMEGAEGFAGADGKFTLDELKEAVLSNRSMTSELLRDELVARCEAMPMIELDDEMVDLEDACSVLASWDGRYDLDSVGAVLFREFLGDFATEFFLRSGLVFKTDFDPEEPVATPHSLFPALAIDDDRVLRGLAAALARLDEAGLAIDVSLGEAQFTKKGDLDIPIHGGGAREGITNVITYSDSKGYNTSKDPVMDRGEVIHATTGLSDAGYVVNYGTSFIMTLAFGADGPEAFSFLTYGESSDVDSPHFSDQTEMFSAKQWKKILFTEEDIAADPNLVTMTLEGFLPVDEDEGTGETSGE